MFDYPLKKFRYLNYILAIFIVLAILLFVRTMVTVSFSKKAAPLTKQESKSLIYNNKNNIMDYAEILRQNPFGQPSRLQPIAVEQRKEKSYGSLSDLTLVGTVIGPR